MKHNLLSIANGFHNPIASTTIKSSVLTTIFKPLLLLFLLMIVGSSAMWSRPTIYGEGLPGLNASGAANWDSNTKEMSTYGEANTYYAEFLNVAATDNSTYRFKIAVNDGGNWWEGAMCGLKGGNYNNVSQSKGNVEIVEGKSEDNQISFKMPFAGDVYVFYKSDNNNNEKVWIVAVPHVSAIGNTTAQSKTMKFDLLIKDGGWNTTINFIKNNVDALTYVYLYASTSGASGAPKRAAAANSLLLYSYKVTVIVNGIQVVTYSDLENAKWYTLDGLLLQGKPTKKGLYIVNGRKVIVN